MSIRLRDGALRMSTAESLFTLTSDPYIKKLSPLLETVNSLEAEYDAMSDSALQSSITSLKTSKPLTSSSLCHAFALSRESIYRALLLRPYNVQILSGLSLYSKKCVEMNTGEGKSLTTILPTFANFLEGRGTTVVTVNDYLAKRDFLEYKEVYKFLGMSVGLIQSGMNEDERKVQYDNDVVYVTNSEFGFDYLRDHLSYTKEGVVLPEGYEGRFLIVDEADSICIDEARTPLIISKSVPTNGQKYAIATKLATALQEGVHYDTDLKKKNVILTEAGYSDCENALKVPSLFKVEGGGSWAGYVVNAVKAKEIFKRDTDYAVVDGNRVEIIDTFSGRVLDGRKYADGLHQAIEAKEGLGVSEQSQVIAKVTFQSFFRLFPNLSAMTGTAMTSASEFKKVYDLDVVEIPTERPMARRDYDDVIYKTRNAADGALVNEILGVSPRPVLVGTTSVEQSERISDALKRNGISCALLNAERENASRESEIVSQAGRLGKVTVSTNMAGRGTDIKLGGDEGGMSFAFARATVADVCLSEEEKSKLPPNPETDYYPCEVSQGILEELLAVSKEVKKEFPNMEARDLEEVLVLANDTTEGEGEPQYLIKLRIVVGKVKDEFKAVLSEEKEEVLKLGGLYVMGTNRHESVRVDRQLRGRSGRQGDPGSSRFFLSFEDDMFTVFGGDKFKKMLEMFRVSDDMAIESKQVIDTLDKVQRTVEEEYEEVRSGVLSFDETLNGQRMVIYQDRSEILNLSGASFDAFFKNWASSVVDDIVDGSKGDAPKISGLIAQFFPLLAGGVLDDSKLSKNGAKEYLKLAVEEAVNSKMGPDGPEREKWRKTAQYLCLVSLDNAFQDHLGNMDSLVESVTLRGYRGLDPKVEYQQDGFELFKGLQGTIRRNSVFSVMNG
ncbi:hypothetical protein TrST_g3974 [Triparma strigata]|uniref:Protein translocase subunit SecA n=1 Tax=Triparma strigata TaxID=1606541 RepID=A0A9W6ZUX1_9STRA|nr:hypothetical protein TrST_g3974 [Triparma strigata]